MFVFFFLSLSNQTEPPKAIASIQSTPAPQPTSVIETKPPSSIVATSKQEIKPTKIVVKPTKQLSSVVRVVEASSPSQNGNNKSPSPKVQIVSSHAEEDDQTKKSAPKSVVHVEAIDGSGERITIASSRVETVESVSPTVSYVEPKKQQPPTIVSSVVEIHASEDLDQITPVENNINDPEYEFLTREPSELTEETYRLPANNKVPNSKYNLKSRSHQDQHGSNKKVQPTQAARNDELHPTGLVTKLGGTIVKDGATTVHETSVLGTYISGKYAQVLQSTSHIYNGNGNKPKIVPSHSLRVLKTAAPHIPKKPHVVESTSVAKQPSSAQSSIDSEEVDEIYGSSPKQNLVRSSRRPAVSSNSFKNRFRSNRPSSAREDSEYSDVSSSAQVDQTTSSAPVTPAYKKPRNLGKPQKK